MRQYICPRNLMYLNLVRDTSSIQGHCSMMPVVSQIMKIILRIKVNSNQVIKSKIKKFVSFLNHLLFIINQVDLWVDKDQKVKARSIVWRAHRLISVKIRIRQIQWIIIAIFWNTPKINRCLKCLSQNKSHQIWYNCLIHFLKRLCNHQVTIINP